MSSPTTKRGCSPTPAGDGRGRSGDPIDSRRYGPVPVELLVGRAWFRYAPLRRIGPLRRLPADR